MVKAEYFKAKLIENGIKVKGKAALGAKENYLEDNLIFTQTSVPLTSLSRFLPSLQLYNFIFLRICSNSHPSIALALAIMVTKS